MAACSCSEYDAWSLELRTEAISCDTFDSKIIIFCGEMTSGNMVAIE